jgi:hypothetical protein
MFYAWHRIAIYINECIAPACRHIVTKSDTDIPAHVKRWVANIGIDHNGRRLCGMFGGMFTLTSDPDGTHILWMYDVQIASGDRVTMRNRYADHMRGDWLEKYYRTPVDNDQA